MKKTMTGLILAICMALSFAARSEDAELNITAGLKDSFFQKLEKGDFNRRLAPHFSEREVWQNVRKDFAEKIVASADKILEEPLVELSFYDYLSVGVDGNRRRSESPYFERRQKLQTLAAACCITGNTGKYLPKLIDYLWAVATEPYWCPYAHGMHLPEDIMVADIIAEQNDLFATATGAEIALILNVLGDELAKFSPGMVEKIRQITLRKTVESVLRPERDPLHRWINKDATLVNNWTPWCASQMLTIAIALERDGKRFGQLIRKMNVNMSRYYNEFPSNGFCEEGVMYWEVGAANFCLYLSLLDQLDPGCMKDVFVATKFRRIGEFPACAMVTSELSASFADAAARTKLDPSLVRAFGRISGSAAMFAYADQLEKEFSPETITSVDWAQMPCHYFARVADTAKPPAEQPSNGGLAHLDYFEPRYLIVRNPDGFSLALKAGNNAESHNHNDLGHFAVYFGADPIVIDAGTMHYSQKNFSAQRYELWYTGAQGHNAPEINGILQQEGKAYTAEMTGVSENGSAVDVSVDLSKAYPAEAGVRDFVRKISVSPEQIKVADSIKLSKDECRIVIRLYAPVPVETVKDEVVFGNKVKLTLKGLTPGKITKLEADSMMAHNYAETIYCIELYGTLPEYEMIFFR